MWSKTLYKHVISVGNFWEHSFFLSVMIQTLVNLCHMLMISYKTFLKDIEQTALEKERERKTEIGEIVRILTGVRIKNSNCFLNSLASKWHLCICNDT